MAEPSLRKAPYFRFQEEGVLRELVDRVALDPAMKLLTMVKYPPGPAVNAVRSGAPNIESHG